MRPLLGAITLASLPALVLGGVLGCGSDKGCRAGTAFVTFTFVGAAKEVDTLSMQTCLDDVCGNFRPVAHRPGAASGSVELSFTQYQAGASLKIVVIAGAGPASFSATRKLDPSCTAVALTVGSVPSDGGSDAAPDARDATSDASDATSDANAGDAADVPSPTDGADAADRADGSMVGDTAEAPSDAGPASGDAEVGAPPCGISHIVISEIRTRGVGLGTDEFIELYNPTDMAVIFDGTWSIDARSSGGTTYTMKWTGTGQLILPNGHHLIAGPGYTQQPPADAALLNGLTDMSSVRLLNAVGVVDAVCFGSPGATYPVGGGFVCEGTPIDNTALNIASIDSSMERKPGGRLGNCVDTGDNAADFAIVAPSTPANASSAPTP